MGSESPLRAAVIGCGRIGSLYDAERTDPSDDPWSHAGAYTGHPETTLVAGVDPVPQRREQFTARWGVPAYATVTEMLAHVRPALWSICTTADGRLEVVRAALSAGAHAIWCEKPLAATLAEAAKLVAACEEVGVPLLVNHSRRFDPFHQELAQRVQAGEWGRIERIVIHYVRGIANYGSHAVDAIRFLLADDIAWLSARDELREPEEDPSLTVSGETVGGVPFQLLPVRRTWYDSLEIDVWGSAGRVTVTHLGREVRQYRVGPSPHWDEAAVLLETPGRFLPGMDGVMRNAVSNLVAHLEGGQPLLSSGRDGLASVAAIWAAKQSAQRHGQQIDVPSLTIEAWEVVGQSP